MAGCTHPSGRGESSVPPVLCLAAASPLQPLWFQPLQVVGSSCRPLIPDSSFFLKRSWEFLFFYNKDQKNLASEPSSG